MDIKTFYDITGGNYEEALSRLMSERIMDKFVRKFTEDPGYNTLIAAMENKDMETAFRAAHTLKGTCLNLGFGKLAEVSSNLTEALRPGNPTPGEDELKAMLNAVSESYKNVIKSIEDLDPLA